MAVASRGRLCPDCGHERLLAFTCKGRHLCPACHQRRVRQTAEWISSHVCHEVPLRQFVFTIPKILRGIFRKRRDLLHLLSWKHSGFHIDGGGEKPVSAHDTAGRKRSGWGILPQSVHGASRSVNPQTVIYRSKRHHNTKRNLEIFKATDFLPAVIDHIPPKGQQTVRYYGLYSN